MPGREARKIEGKGVWGWETEREAGIAQRRNKSVLFSWQNLIWHLQFDGLPVGFSISLSLHHTVDPGGTFAATNKI